MKRSKSVLLVLIYALLLLVFADFVYQMCKGPSCIGHEDPLIKTSSEQFQDSQIPTMLGQLQNRIRMQPFNLFALIIFVLAIIHTFFVHKFRVISSHIRERNVREGKEIIDSFGVEFFGFMGEVEVVFAIWIIPLMIGMANFYTWPQAISYMENLSYTEPLFVIVIMALASTSPIINLAEDCLNFVSKLGGGTVQAWWWAILTIGPLAGSLITEPGAMTISALLLARHFYSYHPSQRFAYGTLGLLFTNISVGGVFTSFAAPPVLMVSGPWQWGSWHMMSEFGWKALIGILIANSLYYFLFRSEFAALEEKRKEKELLNGSYEQNRKKNIFGISFIHLLFLAWTVVHAHHPVIFLGSFMLFLGFYQATLPYQKPLQLKPPLLVGLFLAGLVVHGSLQAWWIEPVLSRTSSGLLLVLSMFLTSFNDNAEITFLATLTPSFTDSMKYAVLAGAVTGGGLTVIANAPNPSGQAILGRYFDEGISAVNLFAAAIFPATIMAFCFYLLYWG